MTAQSDIRQLKLTTGAEIICQVVEWPDEDSADMVIRNAVEIVSASALMASATGPTPDAYRYHTFRPWMTMQEGDGLFLTLNSNHIVGEALPTKKIMDYYNKIIENTNKLVAEDQESGAAMDDWIERLKSAIQVDQNDSDSPQNIISFPSSKKLH